MLDWDNLASAWILGGLVASIVLSVGGLFAARWYVLSLPADYFVTQESQDTWRHEHFFVRWGWYGIKNSLGLLLIVAGVAMLAAPGPGLLTMIAGLCFLSFPGKWTLVLWLMRRPHVLPALNAVRRQAGKPELEIPPRGKSSPK